MLFDLGNGQKLLISSYLLVCLETVYKKTAIDDRKPFWTWKDPHVSIRLDTACFEKRHKRTTLNDGKQFDLAKMQKHPFKQLYVSQTVPKSKWLRGILNLQRRTIILFCVPYNSFCLLFLWFLVVFLHMNKLLFTLSF